MKRALLFTPLLVACSAPLAGQVVLVIDTDALLPPANGQQATHVALFDALAVDVFMPGENDPCTGCSQQFVIDEGIVNAGKASIGIPETPHLSGYRARVRLYHSKSPGAGPLPDTSIEAVVALPAVDDTGEITVSVMLPTDSLAAPIGTLDDPIEPNAGGVTSGHAGTWPGGAARWCDGDPNDGEVCVPGGAFWMGNPSSSFAGGAGASTNLERLVVVSPFFIDAYETTVGDYRGNPTTTVAFWSGSTAGTSPMDWCSYSNSASRNALVLNCIDWSAA